MFSQLAALDTPDIDRTELDLLAGRLNAEKFAALGSAVGASRDDPVPTEDTVLDDQVQVGQRREKALRIFNLRGEAGRTATGALQIRIGENARERTGVMCIRSRDIAFKQGGVCRRLGSVSENGSGYLPRYAGARCSRRARWASWASSLWRIC